MGEEQKSKRMNISLSPDVMKALKDISNRENRPISKQIKEMMEFYIRWKDKVKE